MTGHALPGTAPVGTPVSVSYSRPSARAAQTANILTWAGITLFVVCALVAGSSLGELRVNVGGLSLHPYLLALALPAIVALPRIKRFPRRTLIALVVFLLLYVLSTFVGGIDLGEIIKIVTSAATMIAAALLVRTKADFRAAVLGLALAAAFIAVRGIVQGPQSTLAGIDPVELGNKNSFSLYTLPSVLLGGYCILQRTTRPWLKLLLLACLLTTVLATFQTANRSGWLGVLLIFLLLFKEGRSPRVVIPFAIVLALSYGLVVRYGAREMIEFRMNQTMSDNPSDQMRQTLIGTSFKIAAERPLLGVSPGALPDELGQRLGYYGAGLDPHNVFGHLAGGSGFLTLAALLALGWTLWNRPLVLRTLASMSSKRRAHNLLRMMVILWVIRGMFTQNILFAPAFNLGLGIIIGLCMTSGIWKQASRTQRPAVLEEPAQ